MIGIRCTQVCYKCRITKRVSNNADRTPCQHCRQLMIRLSTKIRVPKKTAPDRVWNKFWEWLRSTNPFYAEQIPT